MSNDRKPQTQGGHRHPLTQFSSQTPTGARVTERGLGDRCGGGAKPHPLKERQQTLPSLGPRGGPPSAGGREKKTPLSPGANPTKNSRGPLPRREAVRERAPTPTHRAKGLPKAEARPGGQKPLHNHHSRLGGSCHGRAKATPEILKPKGN